MVSGINGLRWQDVLELSTETGSISVVVVSRGVCSPLAEVASRCKSLLVPNVISLLLFSGDSLCLRLGDESGFLLTTLLGATSYGVVGNSGTGFERVEVGEVCVDRVFCRMNSQLLGRTIKIRVVKSITYSPWMSLRLRTLRIRPLYII